MKIIKKILDFFIPDKLQVDEEAIQAAQAVEFKIPFFHLWRI